MLIGSGMTARSVNIGPRTAYTVHSEDGTELATVYYDPRFGYVLQADGDAVFSADGLRGLAQFVAERGG